MSLQGELEGMPVRVRRVVRAGAAGIWGVDPSTRGIAVSWGPNRVVYMAFPPRSGAARLSAIYAECKGLAGTYATDGLGAPGLIVMEEPNAAGRPNRELEQACGVIVAGLYDGVRSEAGVSPVFEFVVASRWKKEVVGFGGFGKPSTKEIAAGVEYMALTWARLQGYTGRSFDEVDALAIRAYADLAYDVRVR